VCKITHELPIHPVTAEDGLIYEQNAIFQWFETKKGDNEPQTSPATGAVIGTKLLPAPQARNAIEALVKSGTIVGELATEWTKKLEQEKLVKEDRAKADAGDGDAMYSLGLWYQSGSFNLARDRAQARAWYERSAATRTPQGMAMFGFYLLNGLGGPEDIAFGLVNVTDAAGLGSDDAALLLGKAFLEGLHGLPKDPVRARFWIKKVVDGECEYKHLGPSFNADAARLLRELDGAGE
jgi:TPR repeat protein